MRDYQRFFRRLCLAMGIAGAPALGCADSPSQAAGGDVGGAVDAAVDAGSVMADGADRVEDGGAPVDVETALDGVLAEDGGSADDLGPHVDAAVDAGPPEDDGQPLNDIDGPTDTLVEDAGVVDVTVADAPDVAVAGACEGGVAGTVTCYTAEQLKDNIDNPPFGGKPGYEGPLPPEACPEPSLVLDGCCNGATGPAVLEGDTCCYLHCPGACCGRPLVVDGAARVAELVSGSVWARPVARRTVMAPEAAAALAAAWREDARDEHAAVASFLRFGLELMSLGAPPDLVADAALAAQDEVRHAQVACRLATALDGRTVGPGRLAVADLAPRTDWVQIAAACVWEGCVGETLASAQLEAAARGLQDKEAARLIAAIAADEARHAELAWRAVAWSWREGGPAVRSSIRQAFAEVAEAPLAGDPREDLLGALSTEQRRAGGRLGGRAAAQTNRDTFDKVVMPCAEALFLLA